jgi:hypothetical protein
MGLSIHYSGYIRDTEMLNSLIAEVTDICKTLNWETHTFDADDIKGVSFAPKGSEPVFLTFNTDRRLLSPLSNIAKDIYDDVQLRKELYFSVSTKTQYAGMDAHIAITKLLKHLSKKYLEDFNLADEGYYWETGDERLLAQQYQRFSVAINAFREALEDFPSVPRETSECLAIRLEKLLTEKFKDKKE